MNKLIMIAAFAAATATGGAVQAQIMDGAAARKMMSGATITGVNTFGNPYSVTFSANGSVSGVAGLKNEYKDTGTWWMDGNNFCRQYKTWFEAKVGCFGLSRKGNNVRFHDSTGKVVDESKLK